MQHENDKWLAIAAIGRHGVVSAGNQRQSDRTPATARGVARHSGMRGYLFASALLATPLAAQGGDGLELLLRDGSVLRVAAITGDAAAGFDVEFGSGRRRCAPGDVLAVQGVAASVPSLPAVHLAGGDVVRGALVGGDAGGNRLELLSPVFGRVGIAVDRLAALAAPGIAAPMQFRLPESVGEALFVRAKVGFDTVAGSLHQFGEQGVRFQPSGSDAPRWYRPDEFAALRLRDAVAREDKPSATLLTRVGDSVGIATGKWTRDGVSCELEGGTRITLHFADLAGLAFHRDVVHLSDLTPAVVEESGFDGEVVHPFRRDQNVLGGPLVTAGRSVSKGLGVHSRSKLSFRVPDGCAHFCARVGFDDGAAALGLEPRADVEVLVGDRVVFSKKGLAAGQVPASTGLVPVRTGDLVTLVVEPGAGRDVGDRVNWLLPVFLPASKGP